MWLKREGGAYGFAAIGTIHCSVCVVGPSRECRRSSCANGGRCVQQWDSYYCDCDLTTFTGPTCSDGTISSQSNWSVFLLLIVLSIFTGRITNQPPLSSIIKSRRLTLFGHLARMDENTDASQAVFEPAPENWRRPPGRPRTTWMKNMHHCPGGRLQFSGGGSKMAWLSVFAGSWDI